MLVDRLNFFTNPKTYGLYARYEMVIMIMSELCKTSKEMSLSAMLRLPVDVVLPI